MISKRNIYVQELRKSLESFADLEDSRFSAYTDHQLRRLVNKAPNSSQARDAKDHLNRRKQRNCIEETLQYFERQKKKKLALTESMEKLGSSGKVKISKEDENIVDMLGDTLHTSSVGSSSNTPQGQQNILDMSKFLSRPIELLATNLPIGNSYQLPLDIWDEFTLNPSVRAKLRNYAYLRGDMRVRVSVSGTPFDYGKLIIAYVPYADYNETYLNLVTMSAVDSSFRNMLLNFLSQTTGSVIMSVNENKPVELSIPYINTKPMFRLFNTQTTAIGDTTSFDDCKYAGKVIIMSLNDVDSVSTTPNDPGIQVYAWMENVQLGTPTGTRLVVTTESDERVVGPVESFSSSVVKVANILAEVPFISPFAKASAMIGGIVGRIASLFGWARPSPIREILRTKQQAYSNTAHLIGDDMCDRVVLDPKQELTVDPRVVGVDYDDMVITDIASRISYLTNFTWDTNDAHMVPFITLPITPLMNTGATHLTVNYVQPSAMMFAAQPFKFWRGDIILRFEIECSAFHRGKLAVIYEPNINQEVLISTDLDLNKQYVRIIDIQQTQTVDFRINWASSRSWLENLPLASMFTWRNITVAEPFRYYNGVVYVVPFTTLQSPNSGAININVYASCENLQVNGLSSVQLPIKRQVFTESNESSTDNTEDISLFDLNPSTASTDNICHEHFGEQPLSFRALLKRYTTFTSNNITPGSNTVIYIRRPMYPLTGLPYGSTSSAVNINDFFTYLRYAFLGVRGGIRYKLTWASALNMGHGRGTMAGFTPIGSALADGVTYSTAAQLVTIDGTIIHGSTTGLGFEVEFPCYTNNLFLFSCGDDLTPDASLDVTSDVWAKQVLFQIPVNSSTITDQPVAQHVASAEDFTFLRYIGAPFFSL